MTATELRESFESAGISKSWLMTVDGLIENPECNNDVLAEFVKNDLDFFVPFCTVDPNRKKVDENISELERAKYELGMKGLKLHPWLQSFSITSAGLKPVLEKAGELDMPVLFHDGTPPYSTPLQIADIAEKTPKTKIILGHAGLDDLVEDAVLACLRHDNIYLCLCSGSVRSISYVINKCPPEKLLFGSDSGFGKGITEFSIEKIKAACSDEKNLKMIFNTNSEVLIKNKD